jgi:hypothetical protein
MLGEHVRTLGLDSHTAGSYPSPAAGLVAISVAKRMLFMSPNTGVKACRQAASAC